MMGSIELLAAALGLVCVALTVRRHIACWPTGLAMVLLYIAIFYHARLYSDMLLQVVYVFLQIYGWHLWLHGRVDRSPPVIGRLPTPHYLPWLAGGLAATLTLGTLMHLMTDASFPYVDAFTTVASLVAQLWTARKLLESWMVWICVDVVSIGLYTAKDLYPTAILYFLFLTLAVWGWVGWSSAWKEPDTALS